MVDSVRDAGVPLLIVNLPVEKWLKSHNILVWLKRGTADGILHDVAARGAPVVNLYADFRATGRVDTLFIKDGHYAPEGHAVVAAALVREVARLRKPSP